MKFFLNVSKFLDDLLSDDNVFSLPGLLVVTFFSIIVFFANLFYSFLHLEDI